METCRDSVRMQRPRDLPRRGRRRRSEWRAPMIEFVIHGRGGRGGVTLAKLIAGAYYRRGLHVQAFGIYGAERTGAPVQAYVRVDDCEIDVYGAIATPDHVIIVDPSLVAPAAAAGERLGGWIVVNAGQPPDAFAGVFPGRRVATVDANAIAVAHGLGTQAVPIVNTALLGAVARVLGIEAADVEGALNDAGFGGANVAAARAAFAQVVTTEEPGEIALPVLEEPHASLSFLDERVGARPSTHTGAWASRRPHSRELRPLCSHSCPAGNDVRGFVKAAAAGDDRQALAVLLETSPFPGTCGRVCPAPCMDACNRGALDGAVDVRDIERALADRAAWPTPQRLSGGAHVAVVGSGPAGLSAAYHLARLGHPVTVLEAATELGGLLRSGIPAYRLPRPVLEREIGFILGHGVDARHRTPRRPRRTHATGGCARRRAGGNGAAESARPRHPRRDGRPRRAGPGLPCARAGGWRGPECGGGRGRRRRQHGGGRGPHGCAPRGARRPARISAHARRDAGDLRGGRRGARGRRRDRRAALAGRPLRARRAGQPRVPADGAR